MKTIKSLWVFYLTLAILFPLQVFSAEVLRTTPNALKNALGSPGLVILDVRPAKDYLEGHIPGARNFPAIETYENAQEDGRVIAIEKFQQKMQSLGVHSQDKIVIYDEGSLANAARVLWTLEVFDKTQVTILDHGFDYWQQQQFPVTQDITPWSKSDYVPSIRPDRLATKLLVQLALRNPKMVVLDARTQPEYLGQKSTAKRFGHIPTAVNMPLEENLVSEGSTERLKTLDELQEVYAFIPKNRSVITYCSSGKASAMNYLALRELGYSVANYDASWKQWGNDSRLPIETKSEKILP